MQAVLIQTFVPGMTSATYDQVNPALASKIEGVEGFLGFHSAAIVDGGLQITETWTTKAAYENWIATVVATKVPAEAVSAMQTTVTPLHDLLLVPSLATA
jgi:heme-degrading monooxygenase HmoA